MFRRFAVIAVTLPALALAAPPGTVHAASFGVERLEITPQKEGGSPATQAGSHPGSLTTTVIFNHHSAGKPGFPGPIPDGDAKDLEATLPPGVTVNLLGVKRCTEAQLATETCPVSSQVGVVKLESGYGFLQTDFESVYNLAPASPKVPGEFGFSIKGLYIIVHLVGRVHAGTYALAAEVPDISQVADLYGSSLTLWGVPSAPSHDIERGSNFERAQPGGYCKEHNRGSNECEIPVERVKQPFVTLPTSCGTPLVGQVTADSWQEPEVWTPPFESTPAPAMTGCDRLSFTPSIEVRPETEVADSPTGLQIDMRIPQVESIDRLAEANLKEAVVTLPAGMVLSPSTVSGLGACSEEEVGLDDLAQPTCPESSKVASVQIRTPLLEHPLEGSVYVAQQGNGGPAQGSNPFGSLIALYIVAESEGVLFKTAGEVQLDQSTGQLTARFGLNPVTGQDLPQVPFSELKLHFFGGPRAPLVPRVCGSYVTTTQLTPWSAPESGPPATPQSSFEVNAGCATGAFNPTLSGGTTSNQAGGYSPFVATFARGDGEQELGAIQVHMPPGLLGMLSKVSLCGEPQAQRGECSAESQIGEVSAAAGPGPDPFYVTGGRAYLTGPYHGAPFGLTFVVPARGGPFDLGNVIVRAAIGVNPITAAVTITSNPLPTILQGVPLQVKSVTVDVNRPEFIFNPTSCEKLSIVASLQGSQGATPQESVPFQAGDCAALAFAPKFSVSTSGKTSRLNGASLDAKVIYPTGTQGTQANIAQAKVELPKQLPARLKTLQKACTAAVFEADPASCPAASVVGIVRAITPVLPGTLSGPVYFVSHGGEAFPDLVAVLQGDGVRTDLVGSTFISKADITSSTFKKVPDVPVSSFELYLPAGPDSALSANGNLCSERLKMPTTFTAQDGATIHQSTPIAVTGCHRARPVSARRAVNPRKARRAATRHPVARRSKR